MTSLTRVLTPYEQNQLRKFGKKNLTIEEIGQTPIEYLTGKVEFFGRVFDINRDVLIPRVETEELVELALAELEKKQTTDSLAVAEIGTGAGVIGITLFLELTRKKQTIELYASDVSEKAIKVAEKNCKNLTNNLITKNKIHVFKSNLLSEYPPHQSFDLMVANLPYIPSERIEYLDTSVKDFEPHLALDGGPEGLSLIHTFLKQAQHKLKPNGKVLLEIDHTHTAKDILPLGIPATAKLVKDSFGQNRFALVNLI